MTSTKYNVGYNKLKDFSDIVTILNNGDGKLRSNKWNSRMSTTQTAVKTTRVHVRPMTEELACRRHDNTSVPGLTVFPWFPVVSNHVVRLVVGHTPDGHPIGACLHTLRVQPGSFLDASLWGHPRGGLGTFAEVPGGSKTPNKHLVVFFLSRG